MSKPLVIARNLALISALTLTSACGLPRLGPTKNEIFAGSVQNQGDALIIEANRAAIKLANQRGGSSFSKAFRNAGTLGADTIQPGDTLGLTIWENVQDGLFVATGQNATVLEELQVDGSGHIFVPYAGRIRAAGNSPEAIRRIITNKLRDQTPNPQVEVRRLGGEGASVTLIGEAGGQGVYPIESPTRTLSGMIGKAGGVGLPVDEARVTVIRGNQRGSVFLQDLFDNPAQDIALRGGDRILIEKDRRSFTVLGAAGKQSQMQFNDKEVTAIEALAQVGGLSATQSDPTGIFIFRDEYEHVAERLSGRNLQGTQRVVYVLDLTKPNGVFLARDFLMRDKDTIYITEAPFVQFNKTIAALTGTLNSATGLANAADLSN